MVIVPPEPLQLQYHHGCKWPRRNHVGIYYCGNLPVAHLKLIVQNSVLYLIRVGAQKICLALLLISSPLWGETSSNHVTFQHPLEDKDVMLGVVFSIFQDGDGFIWIGGENGLVRYDGYRLKPIGLWEEGKPKAKPKMVAVQDIIEDRHGRIWVASNDGLLAYDPILDSLIRIPDHASLKAAPLSGVTIWTMAELNNDKLAIGTFAGLYIVDPLTGEGVNYRAGPKSIGHNRIRSLLFDGDNSLWLGVGSGLDKMDIDTGTFVHIKPYPADPDSIPDNGVTSIARDHKGRLWLGTYRGLVHFEPTTEVLTRFEHDANNPHSFSGGDIWSLFMGSNGYLWIATDGNGLSRFNVRTQQFVTFKHESGRVESLSSNSVRTVIEDKNGDIWTGNYPTGVNLFDQSRAPIITYTQVAGDPNSLSNDSVMSMVEDSLGNLWLGTDGGGLNYFDRTSNRFTHYQHSNTDHNTPGANAVLSLLLDSKNILWGGTWGGGAFQMDLRSHRITRLAGDSERMQTARVDYSKRLNNDKVWCFFEDKQGDIWICTHKGGLSHYQRDSGEYVHYMHFTDDPKSISSNHVWVVFEDSDGRFWVGTTGGLGILNRRSGEFSNFSIAPEDFFAIHEDRQGRLWFGTSSGLKLYDKKTNNFTVFGLEQGFVNTSIRSIAEDELGRLWLGTNSGVTMFSLDTRQVRNYSRDNGKLLGAFNYHSALVTAKGEAILGGVSGLRIFQTQQSAQRSRAPKVVLTDFRLFNLPVIIGGIDSPLQEPISQARTITLLAKHSVFSFEFSALNFSLNEKNHYAYRLEGFDLDWNYVGTRHTATYTNLNPGDYIFMVKASTGDGVWSRESTQIPLTILPPWWRTWWAYSLYLLILAAFFAFYWRHRALNLLVAEKNYNLALNRKLSQRITKVLEDERKAIAHEVHDNVNSTVVAARMITQSIERLSRAKEINLGKITQLAQQADQQLADAYNYFRFLLCNLRPEILETLGFDCALEELVEKYRSIYSTCSFEVTLIGNKIKLNDDVGIELYRIAQEAITNAIKHASPTKIAITMKYKTDCLVLTIADNGQGFAPETTGGLGIMHMRERASSLSGQFMFSKPCEKWSTGTVITVTVPLSI